MAGETLRRVGWALIAVGLADIGLMVYCIMNELSYSSCLNIFAVIAGVFLLRQSMTTASVVSFFAAFMLGGLGLTAVLFPLLIPFDLLATQFRLKPGGSALTVLLVVAFLAFASWVCRALTSPAVMEARRAAGVNERKPVTAFVIGVLLAVGLSVIMVLVTRGSSAEFAIAKAKEKTGPGYKYYVSSMSWSGGSGSATVTAYNSTEIKKVKVEW